MNHLPCRQGLLALCATLALGTAAQASTTEYERMLARGETVEGVFPRIVARDDVGSAGSAAFAADAMFNGVVALGWTGGQYCSGVLVSPTTVLSARHCGPLLGEYVRFGTSFGSPTLQVDIQSVFFPAGGDSNSPLLDGGDLAIVTLAQAVPASVALPFMLSDETFSLLGSTVVTMGYGRSGVGSSGATSWDGLRRGGTNVLDFYGAAPGTSFFNSNSANIFSTDFDNPNGSSNTLGWLGSSAGATAFEATTASRDSGGPLLGQFGSEWVVLGVLAGGTTSNSVYGDISWWTGVAPYRAQIEAAGGVFITAIPEPGTYALMALGLGMLAGFGRHASARKPRPTR